MGSSPVGDGPRLPCLPPAVQRRIRIATEHILVSIGCYGSGMGPVLDIVALRSLVAVADCGAFHRAATTMRISQSAVSQHMRRLEKAIGRPLVERQGRQIAFTAEGHALLDEARRILVAHDGAVRRLVGLRAAVVTVGATEHAADLPPVAPVALSLRARRGVDGALPGAVLAALRAALGQEPAVAA
jgi:DNA-binding transcriptional LysR family regulator